MTMTKEYQRAYRARLANANCDCSHRAEVNVCGEKICLRCRRLQLLSRDEISGVEQKTGRGVSQLFKEPEPEFSVAVRFSGNRLVVDAHGHYELVT